jgi:hypothetical protein
MAESSAVTMTSPPLVKVYPFASARLGPYLNGTGAAMCGPGLLTQGGSHRTP